MDKTELNTEKHLEKLKIGIVGLLSSQNLGEQFIADSLEWLIEDCLSENCINSEEKTLFRRADLEGHNEKEIAAGSFFDVRLKHSEFYIPAFLPVDIAYTLLKKIANRISNTHIKNNISRIRHHIWNLQPNGKKRLLKYFYDRLGDVSAIIVDGAGLMEYSANEYYEQLSTLSYFAEKKGVPLIYNAIGRAGEFDPKDYRCQIMIQAMRSPSVKYISARDSLSDVQAAAGNRLKVELLADAAFWSKEAYRVNKTSRPKTVGIGLVRGDACTRYHITFGEENWIQLFCDIAQELERRGYDWFLFTNGFSKDEKLGKKVIDSLAVSEDKLIRTPKSGDELIHDIASFEGIITCRMHSSIAAFTLGIPSVILSWNDKVEKYMNQIGFPERAIRPENFNAAVIVDAFQKALEEGIPLEKQIKMKNLARKSVQDYVPILEQSRQKK